MCVSKLLSGETWNLALVPCVKIGVDPRTSSNPHKLRNERVYKATRAVISIHDKCFCAFQREIDSIISWFQLLTRRRTWLYARLVFIGDRVLDWLPTHMQYNQILYNSKYKGHPDVCIGLQALGQVPARHIVIGPIALESTAKKHTHLVSTMFIFLVSWPSDLHIDRSCGDLGNPSKRTCSPYLSF